MLFIIAFSALLNRAGATAFPRVTSKHLAMKNDIDHIHHSSSSSSEGDSAQLSMTEGNTSDTYTKNDTLPDSPKDEGLSLLLKKSVGSDAYYTDDSYVIPPAVDVYSQ